MSGREEYAHLYKTRRWLRLREAILERRPFCECEYCRGNKKIADVVDHIKPHKGDRRLFFDKNNLRPMNKHCHDSAKQRQEKSGTIAGCNPDGSPLDPAKDW